MAGGWECVGEAMKINNTSRFLGHPLPARWAEEKFQLFAILTSFILEFYANCRAMIPALPSMAFSPQSHQNC